MTSSISVVIPAYNREQYLAAAISSTRAQTVTPSEIIVVDDGSTDGTAEVGRQLGVTLIQQANKGCGEARNAGVAAASGEFLAFLDSDDAWTPRKLELQVAALTKDPALDMVFGEVIQFRGDPPAPDDQLASREPGIVAGAMLIRRETFLRVGPFDPSLRVGEFIDWHARAKDIGLRELILPEVVLLRRLHDSNLGLEAAAARIDYTRVARAALARRRAGGEAP
ncbi:MAG TPA: glycosyltransferase family A protein [Tepidiformaceae bacterium]|nr:glycosyltransferase family A protein [Tepidiformaceae bacterium]